mgnify:CR=1 FL=1
MIKKNVEDIKKEPPVKTEIDKPTRVRRTKTIKPIVEPIEIVEPVLEETNAKKTEMPFADLDENDTAKSKKDKKKKKEEEKKRKAF